jgi:hypothetical protein
MNDPNCSQQIILAHGQTRIIGKMSGSSYPKAEYNVLGASLKVGALSGRLTSTIFASASGELFALQKPLQ